MGLIYDPSTTGRLKLGLNESVGILDIAPGLWIWRGRHPFWREGDDWQPVVTSTFVEAGNERYVLDPVSPVFDNIGLWERLDKKPPTTAVCLMPDHVRDIDLFIRHYNARGYGPMLFFPDDMPKSKLEPIIADKELPGGIMPLYDGRGRLETPMWLPKHRTIIFGDALTERGGELRVWDSRGGHEKRELPALRAMLDLPFERVVISHCDKEPVHSRAEFEKALKRLPWKG